MRHSAAHVLAMAVLKIYPRTKLAIGPTIENGFYYDFDFSRPISKDDLEKIEEEMVKIAKQQLPFKRKYLTRGEAQKLYRNNPYKLELIKEIEGDKLSFYETDDFSDLCRGPHVSDTGKIGVFKLERLAGAYWRGSEKNPMLTRIYGSAWRTKKELDDYLKRMEEALKRDHRKLGQELELFAFSKEIGPGLVLWLPKGTVIKEELEKLGKEIEFRHGYQRVSTPHITKAALYRLSGHLPYYQEVMYPPMKSEDGEYYLKPMNCPHTHMIYKAKKHSYRELPIRYAEFGTVYRYEKRGELLGLLRVRGMTQNDAHIYATEDQALEELIKVMKLHAFYYNLFGFKDYYVELALPDFKSRKDKYFDNSKAWEKSVNLLKAAAAALKVKTTEKVGGAAFYGPKFDFKIKSATGREFGASTNQLDFGSGERFKLTYTEKDGSERTVPYIIHRAPLGSDERFIGFLIEHFAGAFPVWLAPVQAVVIPVSDKVIRYTEKVEEGLRQGGIRAETDRRPGTMQAKIRTAQLQKIPYMLIVGEKEMKGDTVSVRLRDEKDLGPQKLSLVKDRIFEISRKRTSDLWPDEEEKR